MRSITICLLGGAALMLTVLAACTEPASDAPATDASTTAGVEVALTRQAQDARAQWGPCPPIFPAGCEITVLHGDPEQPNADVFLRVPGGYEIPAHSHTTAERMILVSGQLNVHYQGSAPETLTTGEYAYGPPGVPHSAVCASTEACTLFIAFVGPVDANVYEGVIE
jgi:quercetin dioxygenase-like cupin family protein